METRIKIHMIGSAHIDPVWLWEKEAGIIEVLSTCRSADQLIKENEKFIFTLSDVWVYEMIEKYDGKLFQSIKKHVMNGRWDIPGGMYVQPDCNLISEVSIKKHLQLTKEYFLEKFNITVNCGFNVDSFGHSAAFPKIFNDMGFNHYVMMRPSYSEMPFKSNLFNWYGNNNNSSLLTWRIPQSYNANNIQVLKQNISAALKSVQEGIPHVMCFYGVGNHGGGPTKEMIDWISKYSNNKHYELIYSSPTHFFKSVKHYEEFIPKINGELQRHAIGCYSVNKKIKDNIRLSELLAIQYKKICDNLNYSFNGNLYNHLWKIILFNQFHDILGGTSIKSSCDETIKDLNYVCKSFRDLMYEIIINYNSSLEKKTKIRILIVNSEIFKTHKYIEHEPWIHTENLGLSKTIKRDFDYEFNGAITDSNGNNLVYQNIASDSLKGKYPIKKKLLIQLKNNTKVDLLILNIKNKKKKRNTDLNVKLNHLSNKNLSFKYIKNKNKLKFNLNNINFIKDLNISLHEDNTDTWSHGIESYDNLILLNNCIWKSFYPYEEGPLRSSLKSSTHLNNSSLDANISLYNKEKFIDFNLLISFSEKNKLIKLNFELPEIDKRIDGLAHDSIKRDLDGYEYPFYYWTKLIFKKSKSHIYGCLFYSDSVHSLSVNNNLLSFTLLRSPIYAHHDPAKIHVKGDKNRINTDQGLQKFDFRIYPLASFNSNINEISDFNNKSFICDVI